MEQLKQKVSICLRTSDCFTRYSINQFLVILPNVDIENANKINNRISGSYSTFCKKNKINLSFNTVVKAQQALSQTG